MGTPSCAAVGVLVDAPTSVVPLAVALASVPYVRGIPHDPRETRGVPSEAWPQERFGHFSFFLSELTSA